MCSVFEHMFIVFGVDRRVSELCGRHLLHGGQSELHRCCHPIALSRDTHMPVCAAGSYSGPGAAACTRQWQLVMIDWCEFAVHRHRVSGRLLLRRGQQRIELHRHWRAMISVLIGCAACPAGYFCAAGTTPANISGTRLTDRMNNQRNNVDVCSVCGRHIQLVDIAVELERLFR